MSLFKFHKKEFYVVEIDGERPYEARFLAEWLQPEVTIWVSIGLSHAVQFEKEVENGKFDNVKKAITAEFANLPKNTTKRVYIDAESKIMQKATKDIKAKVIPIKKSILKKYVVYPDSTDFTYGDTSFHFDHPEPRDIAFNLFVARDLMNYLKLKFNPDFSGLKIAPGRCSHFKGIKGIDIIDSSYNAHMISMTSVLDMAKRMSSLDLKFSDVAKNEFEVYQNVLKEMFSLSDIIFFDRDRKKLEELHVLEDKTDNLKIEYEKNHFERLKDDKCQNELSPFHSNLLTELERVADHLTNIGYSIISPTGDENDYLSEAEAQI